MAKIKGADRFQRRLNNMKRADRHIMDALEDVATDIQQDAQNSITEGSGSVGRHIPSRPGEPPNNDTGELMRNITVERISVSPPTVHVTSHAPYSAALEYGTSKMAERPFMRPAVEKNRKNIAEKVKEAVNITIRKG